MKLSRRRGKGTFDAGITWDEDQAVIIFAPIAFLPSDFFSISQYCSNRPIPDL